jgi:hypothetical protein
MSSLSATLQSLAASGLWRDPREGLYEKLDTPIGMESLLLERDDESEGGGFREGDLDSSESGSDSDEGWSDEDEDDSGEEGEEEEEEWSDEGSDEEDQKK